MEQQASQNPNPANTDLESQPQPNHPRESYAEPDSMYELSEDFLALHQNIIPDNSEYDKIRKTCPMILSQIWTFLYSLSLCGLTGALTFNLFPEAWNSTGWGRFFLFGLIVILVAAMLLPVYSCFLFWTAFYSKNLPRIRKSVDWLFCCTRFFGSCTLAGVISIVKKGGIASWLVAGSFLSISLGAGIVYVTALCVKNRMEKGEPLGKPIKDFFEPLMKCLS